MNQARKTIVIYGAGAIGRGYMPWVFSPDFFDLVFVEKNESLRNALSAAKRFKTYKTMKDGYEIREVPVAACYAPGEETDVLRRAHAVVTAVGPRNILALAEALKGTIMPVLCCENDPSSVEVLRSVTGNPNVVFAVPDVITSNTASPKIKEEDPLGIVTEDGICYADEIASSAGGVCTYIPAAELARQWTAKLYLHNTPHCIAAYLGSLLSVTYVHETMQIPAGYEVVAGAMREMQETLVKTSRLDEEFSVWYADKELARFGNTLLFDPVSRVAREPFRKLAPNERLLGAAQLCLSAGVYPKYLMLGIMAAFFYDNPQDNDANIRYVVDALIPKDFLRIVMGLEPHEALSRLLLKEWEGNSAFLKNLSLV